jgi:succinate-semialdehyde dehydrogenase / glutarate-semialdehyde dehydrogenase
MALKWRHAGQACITANRVYVQKGVYDQFAEILKQKTSKLVVGHGAEKGTTMGPVTTSRSLDKALNQVEDAKKHGGQIILGGGKVVGKSGYFFEPTIIVGAKKEMLITSEETFAPVLALYSFDTEEEAVTAANNTSVSIPLHIRNFTNVLQMGLASYYFTKNVDRTWRLLENLEAGMIGMNTGKYFDAEFKLTQN